MILKERSNQELGYLKYKSKFREFNRGVDSGYTERNYDTDDLHYTAVFVISEYLDARMAGYEGDEYIADLRKIARFYDMTLGEPRNQRFLSEYWLMATISYFLIGNYGSAALTASRITEPGCYGPVAELLFEIVDYVLNHKIGNRLFPELIEFLKAGDISGEQLVLKVEEFTEEESAESMFFSNVVRVAIRDIVKYSSRVCLPSYSGVSLDKWRPYLCRPDSSKLMWQAQRELGDNGVFSGNSAVVQMPTGVGKTRSIELIIRARYLRRESELAIVLAPTVALCSEIACNLSESLSDIATIVRGLDNYAIHDYVRTFRRGMEVFIVTPEKLSYLLRHDAISLCDLGLLVVDETHLLEQTERGVRLELLLASLIRLQPDVQRILISAVTSDASALSKWACRGEQNVVGGCRIESNEVHFGDIKVENQITSIRFDSEAGNIEIPLSNELYSRKKFVSEQVVALPDYSRSGLDLARDIALSLSDVLIDNGAVALYFIRRDTIKKLFERIAELEKSGVVLNALRYSYNFDDVDRVSFLIRLHYGEGSLLLAGVKFGLLPHYGNLQGCIRSVVEDELSSSRARGVVCTSTLGEGVNLPIKYLMVLGSVTRYQSVSDADLLNVAGRVARPGVHTDGIVFDFHSVCGGRQIPHSSLVTHLHGVSPTPSALSRLFLGYFIADDVARNKYVEFLLDSIPHASSIDELKTVFSEYLEREVSQKAGSSVSGSDVVSALSDVESYVSSVGSVLMDADLQELCHSTLAYSCGSQVDRERLCSIFRVLYERSLGSQPLARNVAYRTQLSGTTVVALVESLREGSANGFLHDCWSNLEVLVQLFLSFDHEAAKKFSAEQQVAALQLWMSGGNVDDIRLAVKQASPARKKTLPAVIRVEKLVSDTFQFRLSYFVARIIDVALSFGLLEDGDRLQLEVLQRHIRYGVSNSRELFFCENVLNDRLLAREFVSIIGSYGLADSSSMRYDALLCKADVDAFVKQLPEYCRDRISAWLAQA